MSPSNYYDNIASIYDQTRWMSESVAEEVADYILELVNANPDTSFLEPGVGTGLNVLPLVKRGYSVTGIDISQEMLDQFRHKLKGNPENLTLIQADASQLPLPDNSFDVVLTVHMVHTVSHWQKFLGEVERVLKPGGFYLNAQWITPPARMEFEHYFKAFLAKGTHTPSSTPSQEINVEDYFGKKGYRANYAVAKKWLVSNTVEELLGFLHARAYGLCWRSSDEDFEQALNEFETFCLGHYGSLKTEISSEAQFEIWAYQLS
ncbi:class I SAM-dependent methyltransferase [Acaryochloris sp. CCMEE 5410]|uniref:class I SAM-dependent methyltransferase n=1 Tax=Acaryochloris sp. CCMEE 5410 TaxID=310037 RepID=UPI000248497C|nr:class I SAM-dependent methyltransferase [Acaryochloris sp. CCMEE 5410]KAI9130750.1 methyltransferase domain-containing protein [Acaryochloris sp. CCMEE 5410]